MYISICALPIASYHLLSKEEKEKKTNLSANIKYMCRGKPHVFVSIHLHFSISKITYVRTTFMFLSLSLSSSKRKFVILGLGSFCFVNNISCPHYLQQTSIATATTKITFIDAFCTVS